MNNFERAIAWTRQLDDLLATDGVHVTTMADELGTSRKTVHRMMDAIKSQGMDVRSVRVDENGEHWYVYQYADRRKRLYARSCESSRQRGPG